MNYKNQFAVGEIWSLWDMQGVNVAELTSSLTYLAGVVKFFEIAKRKIQDTPDMQNIAFSGAVRRASILSSLKNIAEKADVIGLKITNKKAWEAFHAAKPVLLENAPLNHENLRIMISSIELLLNFTIEEMNNITFLSIDAQNADLYSSPMSAFSENIFDAFPDSQFDLEEGAKCYALGRHTACIFHLMRAMEAAVAVIANKLDATVKNKHEETLPWGILTANIGDKIEKMQKGPKRDAWEQCKSLLFAVNRAWRTKGAHPNTIYNEEHAKTALGAVKSFLDYMIELNQA